MSLNVESELQALLVEFATLAFRCYSAGQRLDLQSQTMQIIAEQVLGLTARVAAIEAANDLASWIKPIDLHHSVDNTIVVPDVEC